MIGQSSFFKATVLYTFLGMLPLFVNYLLIPLFTDYLTPKDYGILTISTILQTYLSLLITLGLDNSFGFLIQKSVKFKNYKQALQFSIFFEIFISSILILPIFYFFNTFFLTPLFSANNFTFIPFGLTTFFITLLNVIYNLLLIKARVTENLKHYAFLSFIFLLTNTSFSLFFIVYRHSGALGALYAKLITFAAVLLLYTPEIIKTSSFILKKSILKNILTYAGPFFLYGVFGAVFDNVDRIVLASNYSLNDLGIYNLGIVLASASGVVINSFNSAISPKIYQLFFEYRQEKYKEINEICYSFFLISLFLLILCFALFPFFVLLFINNSFVSVITYLPFFILSFIPRIIYIIFSYPIFLMENRKILPLINFISALFGLLSAYFFLMQFQIKGLCVSLFLTKLVQSILAIYFSRPYKMILARNFRRLFIFVLLLSAWAFYTTFINTALWLHFIPLAFFAAFVLFYYKEILSRLSILKTIR